MKKQIEITQAEARKALQVRKDTDQEHVYINFKAISEQKAFPPGKDQDYMIEARNVIIRPQVHESVRDRGFFENHVPYDEPCNLCKGTGERYKLQVEEVEHKHCDACSGDGFVWIPCRKCQGTGRFKKEDGNLRINVECKACKRFENEWPEGKKYHYRVRCRDCRGLDKKVRYIGLQSTTRCQKCKGLGFFPKTINNPALSFETLAQAIEKTTPQPEPEATVVVDRVIDLQLSNQEMIEKMFAE